VRTLAAFALALLTACAADGPPASRPGGGVPFAAERAEKADWSRAVTVEIRLDEFAFQPDMLRLKAEQPTKLVIRNAGRTRHSFAAPELIKASAVRNVVPAPGETLPTVSYNEINVSAGSAKELYIVPIERGTYELKCGVVGHTLFGMTGTIVID